MTWVAILRLLLSLASSVAGYVKDRQLMDAGAAEAALQGIREADDAIKRARAARRRVDPNGMHDDRFNRDRRD